MTKNNSLSEKLEISKAIDIINLAKKQGCARFSSFYDPAVRALLTSRLKFERDIKFRFWGGYNDAERSILCVYPEYIEDSILEFPITLLKVSGKFIYKLTHRDYLGSLMALGIKRETIGDIIAEKNCSYIFCVSEIADYILTNLQVIGKVGVIITKADINSFVSPEKKIKVLNITIASMRLDALLAGMLNISRSNAAELIKSGKVNVNFMECDNLSRILLEGDLISVRGFGRLKIGQSKGMTKKGRIHLFVEKYI